MGVYFANGDAETPEMGGGVPMRCTADAADPRAMTLNEAVTDNVLDEAMAFVSLVACELGAAATGAMAVVGDRLGLYRAMAASGPVTASDLAARCGCAERYVREWLFSQAAAGWVHFDEDSARFDLPEAHAAVLADESSPMFLGPSIQMLHPLYAGIDRLTQRFRTGDGIGWGEHHADLHKAVGRFSRSAFSAAFSGWVESAGVADRLRGGGRVLDIGCGEASALIALAQVFPEARCDGLDSHNDSIETARRQIDAAGLKGRVAVRTADANSLPVAEEGAYDLVLLVDCLHDMGDPVAAATAARKALAPGGAVLIVEPASSDRVAENFNPIGRYYYAISTAFCMPSALSQPGGWALGNQGGPARVCEICSLAGLGTVVEEQASPFNMVFSARP